MYPQAWDWAQASLRPHYSTFVKLKTLWEWFGMSACRELAHPSASFVLHHTHQKCTILHPCMKLRNHEHWSFLFEKCGLSNRHHREDYDGQLVFGSVEKSQLARCAPWESKTGPDYQEF